MLINIMNFSLDKIYVQKEVKAELDRRIAKRKYIKMTNILLLIRYRNISERMFYIISPTDLE